MALSTTFRFFTVTSAVLRSGLLASERKAPVRVWPFPSSVICPCRYSSVVMATSEISVTVSPSGTLISALSRPPLPAKLLLNLM